jgi:ribonuclease P protein component
MRIGLVVPRFKQSAVARNRLKRRLRELARLRLLPTDLPADVVIRVRPEAYRTTFALLADEITRALAQLARWCDASALGREQLVAPPRPVSDAG